MEYVAIDTETWLIAPGRLAPRLVCLSASYGSEPVLLGRDEALSYAQRLLKAGPELVIVGHNISYDLAVLVQAGLDAKLVWDAYDAGRIRDTMIHSRLIHIGQGTTKFDPDQGRPPKHSLAALSEKFLGEKVEGKNGDDVWRLRYRELEGVPISKYPIEAHRYAAEDARITWRVWAAQRRYVEQRFHQGFDEMPDLERQCAYAWPLHLLGAWGMRTDPEAVEALEQDLSLSVDEAMVILQRKGLYRPNRTKDMKEVRRLVEAALGDATPLTPKGSVSTSVETLEASGDEDLQLLASISNDQKLLSTYVPLLRKGTEKPLNPRYGLVDSGRTSASKPNVQNQPRRGGARECFVPRPGKLFVCADYHVAELCGLAQVLLDLFGESEMATALQAGRELHLETAAGILGISYEDAVTRYEAGDKQLKETRQLSKALNFGLPGGLGPDAFAAFAKAGYGLIVSVDEARALKADWISRYPEMTRYFKLIGEKSKLAGGSFRIEQHRSGRLRGACTFTSGANTLFQGLVADGAKLALWKVTRECYLPSDSPLYGSRPVAFVHDEVIIESSPKMAQSAAQRLSQVMVEGMASFIPDIPIKADAHLMARWYKDAEPIFNDSGELIPWTP